MPSLLTVEQILLSVSASPNGFVPVPVIRTATIVSVFAGHLALHGVNGRQLNHPISGPFLQCFDFGSVPVSVRSWKHLTVNYFSPLGQVATASKRAFHRGPVLFRGIPYSFACL